LTVCSWNCCLF